MKQKRILKVFVGVLILTIISVGSYFIFSEARQDLHISIKGEEVFRIGSFPITNSLIMSWIACVVIVMFALLVSVRRRMVPGTLQNIGESIVEAGLNFCQSVMGNRKNAERAFPIVATLFIFILLSNWLGLVPGVGSIGSIEVNSHEYAVDGEKVVIEERQTQNVLVVKGEDREAEYPIGEAFVGGKRAEIGEQGLVATTYKEHFIPVFRSAYADLNMTLALAVIAVIATHIFGIVAIGFVKHGKKYINFSGPMQFFVGILELFGEISKIISFSFRLFGNVFAGEVLLVMIMFVAPAIAPFPFFGLEIFVGFIQALVFSMLTLTFIAVATMEHEH